MPKLHIPQDVVPFSLLAPAADAGGRTSTYKSLKGAVKAWIVVHINQGAANTVALSPMQALAVAGTTPIAIRATRIWAKLTLAATDFTKAADAVDYTTDAGVEPKVIVFEIDPNLTLTPHSASGVYDCVALTTGASAAANITSAMLYVQMRHKGASVDNVLAD
jgi:hypothetical protein